VANDLVHTGRRVVEDSLFGTGRVDRVQKEVQAPAERVQLVGRLRQRLTHFASQRQRKLWLFPGNELAKARDDGLSVRNARALPARTGGSCEAHLFGNTLCRIGFELFEQLTARRVRDRQSHAAPRAEPNSALKSARPTGLGLLG
jgi:hypothetical protein